VQTQEEEIKEHFKKFPDEALLFTGQSAVRLLVKKGVPLKIVGLLQNGIGLAMAVQRQKKGVQGAISKAKEFVVYTAFNKLLQVYQKRRNRIKTNPA